MKTYILLFLLLLLTPSHRLMAQTSEVPTPSPMQTVAIPASVAELDRAVSHGIAQSVHATGGHDYQRAFAICRSIDALISAFEKDKGQTLPELHFLVTKERLRMYTRLNNAAQAKSQLEQLNAYARQSRPDSVESLRLLAEAAYYKAFGMPDKSNESYKNYLSRQTRGLDEKQVAAKYQTLLKQAEKDNNAPLAITLRKMYRQWEDSVKLARSAQKLQAVESQNAAMQQSLDEKSAQIKTRNAWTWTLTTLSVLLLAGVVLITLMLLHNLRKQRKLNRGLMAANENNSLKSAFIDRLSDIVQPSVDRLNAALRQPVPNKEALQTQANDIGRLLHDLKVYTELEKLDSHSIQKRAIDVESFAEQVMDECRPQFAPAVEIHVDAPHIQIHTDPDMLRHILVHLLSNAARHTSEGRVTLDFKKRSAHTHQFRVTDTGPGIAAERRPQLFTPFTELHDLAEGTGLGLPTAALMAQKLEGTLSIDDEYRKGTRFVLELHA